MTMATTADAGDGGGRQISDTVVAAAIVITIVSLVILLRRGKSIQSRISAVQKTLDIETSSTAADRQFMQEAVNYANAHSEDPDTKVGALIVTTLPVRAGAVMPPTHILLQFGTNRMPTPLKGQMSWARTGRVNKYSCVLHAEEDALLKEPLSGVGGATHTMYCTLFPCDKCTRWIVERGIDRVVFGSPLSGGDIQYGAEASADMLSKAGVSVSFCCAEEASLQSAP